MAQEKQERTIPPPYLPYRTFKGFIEGLKASSIPAKIDRTILRNRSGTEQATLLSALQYLGLITSDGTPTASMEQLVGAEGPNHQKALHDILTMRYPFMVANKIKLENAVPSQLLQALNEAGVTGDTSRKAMAFFLAAAQDAQVPLSSYLKVRPGRPGGSTRRRARAAGPNADISNGGDDSPALGTSKSVYQTLIDILDTQAMDDEEQKAVWTLLKYVKRKETESGA